MAVYPVSRRFIGIGKESASAIGTAVAPTVTVPMTTFDPEDKPTWLRDTAWRNAMAATYGIIQGPEMADVSLGGPFYGDTIGYFLMNLFGDYAVTGSTPTNSTTTTVTANPGDTTLTLTSVTGYVAGVSVQVGTGTTAEIRKQVGAPSGNVITLDTPLYYTHTSGAAVVTVVAPYTHVFYLLNNGVGAGGSSAAQPPTYTLTDFTDMTPTVGARTYSSFVMSDITFTGNAEQLLTWSGKGSSWLSQIASTRPTAQVSTVATQAAWRSQVGIGGVLPGAAINDVQEWQVTISRATSVEWTDQNSQNPFSIVRGPMTVTGSMNFMPAIDETPLTRMLSNTQPQIQIQADNGLSGANQNQVQFDSLLGAFITAKPNAGGVPFGFDTTWESVANTTNVGQSAGFGPMSVSLINNVYTY